MEGLDHYFLLDMNQNVFMHSKVPVLLREQIPIENIEYGVTRAQMSRTDDIVPTG